VSIPFFFDPNFNAELHPIEIKAAKVDDKNEPWDKASVHQFRGTYGDYVLNKVAKVFPQLRQEVF
jgi:isopenicillin N synthase-like dioxygenase